jgi:hypothetical protein
MKQKEQFENLSLPERIARSVYLNERVKDVTGGSVVCLACGYLLPVRIAPDNNHWTYCEGVSAETREQIIELIVKEKQS